MKINHFDLLHSVLRMSSSNGSRTEYDSVHPRFIKPLTAEEYENCIRTSYYYCNSCELHFAADVEGLRYHFKKPIARHKPCGSCFYCKGPVYHYFYKDEFKIYHDCP